MQKLHFNKAVTIKIALVGAIFFLLFISAMVSSVAKASPSGSVPRALIAVTGTPVQPVISLAYHRPVTSSTPCSIDEGPEKAVNGTWLDHHSVSAGNWYGDNWCSSADSKWLQIDLGQNYYITEIVVYHDGSFRNEFINAIGTAYTTRDFTIYGIKDTGSPWSQLKTIATITNNVYVMTQFNFYIELNQAPIARFIRIKVTKGAQPGQANVARIYDVIVNGTAAP